MFILFRCSFGFSILFFSFDWNQKFQKCLDFLPDFEAFGEFRVSLFWRTSLALCFHQFEFILSFY